jgi:hypothetical protein
MVKEIFKNLTGRQSIINGLSEGEFNQMPDDIKLKITTIMSRIAECGCCRGYAQAQEIGLGGPDAEAVLNSTSLEYSPGLNCYDNKGDWVADKSELSTDRFTSEYGGIIAMVGLSVVKSR